MTTEESTVIDQAIVLCRQKRIGRVVRAVLGHMRGVLQNAINERDDVEQARANVTRKYDRLQAEYQAAQRQNARLRAQNQYDREVAERRERALVDVIAREVSFRVAFDRQQQNDRIDNLQRALGVRQPTGDIAEASAETITKRPEQPNTGSVDTAHES